MRAKLLAVFTYPRPKHTSFGKQTPEVNDARRNRVYRLLGLLLFALGVAVSMTRGRTGVVAGSSSDPADSLYRLIRAHGNTAEYAPMLAVLFLLVGARNPATWLLWTMIVSVVSRYLIAIGMIAGPTLAKPQPLRFVGALGTYLTGILLCFGAFMTRA